MITGKINVKKLDKTKFFEGKQGALYADIVLIETPNSQYGDDYMIAQGVSKEDRAKGIKGAILGNARIIKTRNSGGDPKPPKQDDDSDDVPF